MSDDETEILSVPVRLRRAGREIKIVIDGTDPFPAKADARLIKLLLRARRFNATIAQGEGVPFAALAQREGVSPSYFTRLVRLSYLAPDITQAILDGRHPLDFRRGCVGPQRVRDLMGEEAEELLRHRFEIFNVWRPIRGPLRDAPLAVCDATSVAFADFVPSDLVYRDRIGETYRVRYNPAHRWFYVPEMRADEAVLTRLSQLDPDLGNFADGLNGNWLIGLVRSRKNSGKAAAVPTK